MVVSIHCAYTVIVAAVESQQMLHVGYVLYRALVVYIVVIHVHAGLNVLILLFTFFIKLCPHSYTFPRSGLGWLPRKAHSLSNSCSGTL